jgi:hypothetical protein
MRRKAKPPEAVAPAARGTNQKPREGFKGRVDHITRRSQARPLPRLMPGLRGYVYQRINDRGERASADA